MVRLLALLLSATLAGATACSPSGAARVDAGERSPTSLQERYTSLEHAVRSIPSIQVANGEAFYRGAHSFTADQTMRVAAEGRIVGSFSQASALYPLAEIKAIRLVKPNDAQQRYGQLAANGVIELILL